MEWVNQKQELTALSAATGIDPLPISVGTILILIGTLAALLSLYLQFGPLSEEARRARLVRDLETNMRTVDKLQQQILNNKREVDEAKQELDKLQKKIDENQKQIDENQKKFDENQKQIEGNQLKIDEDQPKIERFEYASTRIGPIKTQKPELLALGGIVDLKQAMCLSTAPVRQRESWPSHRQSDGR